MPNRTCIVRRVVGDARVCDDDVEDDEELRASFWGRSSDRIKNKPNTHSVFDVTTNSSLCLDRYTLLWTLEENFVYPKHFATAALRIGSQFDLWILR